MRNFFILLVSFLLTSGAFAAESVPAASKPYNLHLDMSGLNLYNVRSVFLGDADGSNTMELSAPTTLADDNTKFTLPPTNGVAGQTLVGDGNGGLSYGNAGYWTSVCASGCDYTSIQAGITGLGTGGGVLYVLVDTTTTGIVIADNTTNLTIVGFNFPKITKSGTTPSSLAITVGDGCSRIMIKGFEFENWDESGDYVFYAENSTPPEYVFVMESILNSYTNKHNFDTVIVSGNYVYDTSVID